MGGEGEEMMAKAGTHFSVGGYFHKNSLEIKLSRVMRESNDFLYDISVYCNISILHIYT
jgi:hypothetical protein